MRGCNESVTRASPEDDAFLFLLFLFVERKDGGERNDIHRRAIARGICLDSIFRRKFVKSQRNERAGKKNLYERCAAPWLGPLPLDDNFPRTRERNGTFTVNYTKCLSRIEKKNKRRKKRNRHFFMYNVVERELKFFVPRPADNR